MQENVADDGDRIEGLSAEIGKDAADVGRTRADELGKEAEIARIDGEIDALSKRRDALRAEGAALHEREIADEREIARDVGLLAGQLGDAQMPAPVQPPHPGPVPSPRPAPPPPAQAPTYDFFVDGVEYRTDQARMSARQIKAKVPGWDASHDLSLEGIGHAPDRIVPDDEVEDFAAAPAPMHFSSVPKANFGTA